MLYKIENAALSECEIKDLRPNEAQPFLGFLSLEDARQAIGQLGGGEHILNEAEQSGSMQFYNHEGCDLMCVHIPRHKSHLSHDKIMIYTGKNALLFISDNQTLLQKTKDLFTNEKGSLPAFERILCIFFEKLSVYDVAFFDAFEQEISELENALIESQKREFVKEIVSLRRRLMALKRHYEQLLDLLDELQENENGVLDEKSLSYFKIFSSKADRHYHNILNLRDYVTQVREAYQSAVDIDLNRIMKVFTVITAIFLPLTLIAGWYGMNLKMPEYSWPYTYPAVTAVSVCVVLFSIFYFKKHKWF